jgi:hypothetical protein
MMSTTVHAAATQRIPVLASTLKSRASSRSNRLLARELAWDWVAARWPRLLPSASDRERPHLQTVLPGRRLHVTTSDDGHVWSLEVAHSERDGGRTWETRATVSQTDDGDVIGLRTTCSNAASSPPVIAPPKLLGAWVEHLELDDGGVPVLGEPRMVKDGGHLAAFGEHLLLPARTLPVIALCNKTSSRWYGVDPRGLAEAVKGLAHVTCVAPELAVKLGPQFAKHLGPVQGAVRIYRPGFTAAARREDHPLLRDPALDGVESAHDMGAFRRLLCRRICELSVG